MASARVIDELLALAGVEPSGPARAAAVLVARTPTKAARYLARLDAAGDDLEARHTAQRDALRAILAGAERCRVCGRELKDPESVRLGIGPDCRAKAGAAAC